MLNWMFPLKRKICREIHEGNGKHGRRRLSGEEEQVEMAVRSAN